MQHRCTILLSINPLETFVHQIILTKLFLGSDFFDKIGTDRVSFDEIIGMLNDILVFELRFPIAPFSVFGCCAEASVNLEFNWPLDKSSKGFLVLFVTLNRPVAFVESGNEDKPPLLANSAVFAPFRDFLITELSFSSPRILNGVDDGAIIVTAKKR